MPTLKMKFLIVDDSPLQSKMLSEILMLENFEADTASGGMEALMMCRETTYDFILIDVNMPGMNGPETAVEIKKIHPNCKIFFVTGQVTGVADAVDSFNGDGFLFKPLDINVLKNKVLNK